MKSNRFLRVSALLLAVLMLGTMVLSCTNQAGGDDTTAETTEETRPPIEINITDPAAEYVLVRPDEAAADVIETAKNLRDTLKNRLALKDLAIKSDFVTNTPGFRESENEILVGNCDRDATREVLKTLKFNDYAIAVVGTKLVIVGGNDEATAKAVRYFLSHCLDAGGKFTEGEIYRFSAEYPLSELKINGTDFTQYRLIYPASQKSKYIDAVNAFNERIQTLTGYTLEVYAASEGEFEYEIQFGDCKRAPSAGLNVDAIADYVLSSDGKRIAVFSLAGVPALFSAQAMVDEYIPANAHDTLSVSIPAGQYTKHQNIGTPLQSGATMRIMSNNILGNSEISERAGYLTRIYMTYYPDIIGLQECGSNCYSLVVNRLSDYYAVTCRTIPGVSESSHTPIMYRKDLYDVVESGVFLLDQRWTLTNTKTLSWAVFANKNTGEKFAVINIHAAIIIGSYDTEKVLGYKATNGVEGAKWREDNSRQILEKLAELQTKYGASLPVFVMGDLNATATQTSIKMLVQNTGLVNAVSAATVTRTPGASFHNVGSAPDGGGSPIDHILATSATVNIYTYIINLNQDAYKSSDHCQVWCDISFK